MFPIFTEKKLNYLLLMVLFLAVISSGCLTNQETYDQRQDIASGNGEKLKIGVAWPLSTSSTYLYEGVQLAAEEINRDGGVMGREIILVKGDDQGDVNQGLKVAEKFASDPEIMAVIGHKDSYITNTVGLVYETGRLLFFSPKSTNPKISQKGYEYFFRNVPTDEEIGTRLARVAQEKGYQDIMITYADNLYGLGLANAFEKEADELGLEVVNRYSFNTGDRREFRYIIEDWDLFDFDAVLYAGTLPAGGLFLKELREQDYQQLVLGGNGLDSPELLELAGKSAEGVLFCTEFNQESQESEVKGFIDNFQTEYGFTPDTSAALGYDALQVIVTAMERAGSVDPQRFVPVLREIQGWQGVTGIHNFADNGDVKGKDIYYKTVENNGFSYIK